MSLRLFILLGTLFGLFLFRHLRIHSPFRKFWRGLNADVTQRFTIAPFCRNKLYPKYGDFLTGAVRGQFQGRRVARVGPRWDRF